MIAIDPMVGPVKEGIQRGVPLAQCDELTRRSIAELATGSTAGP
ncbi:hypothetical protein O7607_12500 [Micromonospora sp. WMMA1949]|nr:hypothetical protein [Micromonospora sp. WMMA1949]MCZ7426556.1 hypothetical protein [Micromonospora sp. WMMA1949]